MQADIQTYLDEYIGVLQKYAVFEGRASRREFWVFNIMNALLALGVSILSSAFGAAFLSVLMLLYFIAIFVPSLAVSIRRLHDIDKSGWWILIGIIPVLGGIIQFIFYILPGTEGPNRFGAAPYQSNHRNPAPEKEAITIEQIKPSSPFEPK